MLQLLSMVLIGLCFGVTYHVGQRLGLEAGVASMLQNLYDALFDTFASFCQQGKLKTSAFWDIAPCSLVGVDRRF
jgi:hypothetical protein